MGSLLVRFAELGLPWRLLLAQILVALQGVAIAVGIGRIFRELTPGLFNRSSYIAAWLNRFANSQRKAAILVSCHVALAVTVAASPVVVDHLREQRTKALVLLLLFEVLAGLSTAPYTARALMRRQPRAKTGFVRRVTEDLVAGKLAGAFAEVMVAGAAIDYPAIGQPFLRYASTRTASDLIYPAAKRLVSSSHSTPTKRKAKKSAPGRKYKCRAKKPNGTLCRNPVWAEGERCHHHRGWFK